MERQELLNEVKKKNNDKVIQEKMCKTFSMRRLEVVSGTQAAEDFTERWPALLCANGFIRVELFANPKVMFMTDLTSRLVASMNSKGIIQVKGSTKKHIRRKLEREFGGALHIFPDDNGKLLLYPDNLSLRKLVKENHNLKNIVNIVPS
ncbi:hypothetical protein N1851_031026 [Merluccius polli]|uniref:Uncharacterized protein n=1 Tax=Merluccius polli TaxID=89951 RepID=A0AA47M4K0_MERPO|nr:hypothetical protein N1851_031026 [Merluccius polli]